MQVGVPPQPGKYYSADDYYFFQTAAGGSVPALGELNNYANIFTPPQDLELLQLTISHYVSVSGAKFDAYIMFSLENNYGAGISQGARTFYRGSWLVYQLTDFGPTNIDFSGLIIKSGESIYCGIIVYEYANLTYTYDTVVNIMFNKNVIL